MEHSRATEASGRELSVAVGSGLTSSSSSGSQNAVTVSRWEPG